MNYLSVSRVVPPAGGFLSLQFAYLWCGFCVTLVLLAIAEWGFLRQMGVEYIPKSSLQHVSIGDFSVSADGRWAVARMGFCCAFLGTGFVDDVVVYDLRRHTAQRLHFSQLEPRCVAIAPTGESLAFACADLRIWALSDPVSSANCGEPLDDQVRLLYRVRDKEITHLAFSPDGLQLAVMSDRHIQLLRLPQAEVGGSATLVHQWPYGGDTSRMAFSSDSRQLVVFGLDGQVRWYDVPSGRQIGNRVLTVDRADLTALSADGKLAAYLNSGRLHVWNLATDHELWHDDITGWHRVVWDVMGFSPDGHVLATACFTDTTYQIHGYDANTGACLGKSPRYDVWFKGLVVSADHTVYFWDDAGVIRAWQVGQDREQWRFSWPLDACKSTSLVSTAGP